MSLFFVLWRPGVEGEGHKQEKGIYEQGHASLRECRRGREEAWDGRG